MHATDEQARLTGKWARSALGILLDALEEPRATSEGVRRADVPAEALALLSRAADRLRDAARRFERNENGDYDAGVELVFAAVDDLKTLEAHHYPALPEDVRKARSDALFRANAILGDVGWN